MPLATRSRDFPLGREVRLADLDVDPYPILARLREEEPVTWVAELGMWFVTRRADVISVLADTDAYRSGGPRSPVADTFGPQMLSADGEEQRRYKNPCIPTFRPRSVREHARGRVQANADALVDAFAARGEADARREFAARLSLDTITGVLGLEAGDAERIRAWYEDFAAALANYEGDPAVRERGQAAARGFREHARPRLRDLERAPDASLLAALVGVDAAAPERLTDDEILCNALVILFGGIETTESMISNALWALLSHPEALAEVRRDASLLENAIEESMRWEPAVQTCTRSAGRSLVLRGVEIGEGEMVQCMVGAANRDPEHYPEPDRFDIRRANASSHLAFGFGRHVCLGAALARLEAHVALTTLLERLPGLRLDPDRPSAPRGHEFRKPPELWVLWDA